MIPNPTTEEIEFAWQEVQRINNPIDRVSISILVPHAGIHESRVVALTAMRYLRPQSSVLIVGTNHNKVVTQPGLTFIQKNSDVWQTEHSIRITATLLEYLGHTTQEYVFADTTEVSINTLIKRIEEGWSIVFTSDLTHYLPKYDALRMEDIYLEKLSLGKIVHFLQPYHQNGPCGIDSIQIFSRILYLTHEVGRIVEYRHSPGQEVVGYAGVVAGAKDWTNILAFDFRYLLEHSRDVLTDILNGREVYTPSWSVLRNYKQGVFVTLRSNRNISPPSMTLSRVRECVAGNCYNQVLHMKTRACIGRYENNKIGDNTLLYITQSTRDCLEDARTRWHNPIQLEELSIIKITVEILSPRSTWKPYTYTELSKLGLSPANMYGFFLQYSTGEKGTFLPDVWNEFSTRSLEDLLVMLEEKVLGQNLNKWRESSTIIFLYTSLSISE